MTWDVRVTPNARRDRDHAIAWLDEHYPDRAEQFIDDYFATVRRIEEDAGRPSVDERGFRHVAFNVFRYHLWYRLIEGSNIVYVVAVRFQGRDPDELDRYLRTT